MVRTSRWLAASSAALVAVILPALPAHAAGETGYTVAPASGPAGTSITVTATTPCAAPTAPATFAGVGVVVVSAPGTQPIVSKEATANPDRTWTASITIPSGVRNGEYHVDAFCVDSNDKAYDAFLGETFVVTSAPGQVDPAIRLAGTDRVLTAIAAAEDIFPEGAFKPDSVILSRADSYADALAGTPLGDDKNAPLLLTGRDSLDPRTSGEIDRLLGSKGTIYVLGGTAAISDAVVSSLTNSGYTVTRLAGTNRYETAVKIADEIGTPSALLLANGNDFRDGLVAGAAAPAADTGGEGGAVLLTDGSTMPAATQAYLDAHPTAAQFAIGSPAAAAAPSATSIAGSDPADTSQKVAQRFFTHPAAVSFASSASFPDALSGGVHATAFGAPLLLTDPNSLPGSVSSYLTGAKADVVIAFVYGGTAAISESVRSAIVQAIT